MPEAVANGVRLYYEVEGSGGEPLVLVHGSWTDATSWQLVTGGLASSFLVVSYDRRGHSRSERPSSHGSLDEDGDDLASLLETLDLAPAHVMTSSFGGIIALRLAARRPEIFRSLSCHEPPLLTLLADDSDSETVLQESGRAIQAVAEQIVAGAHEQAARLFVEQVALGPGAWESELTPEAREIAVQNAPTFLDEIQDPSFADPDHGWLAGLPIPVNLTEGSESPPLFRRIADRLSGLIPDVHRETIEGAAHVPHLQAPQRYVEVTTRAIRSAA